MYSLLKFNMGDYWKCGNCLVTSASDAEQNEYI